ncbi:hypothetical protein AB0B66_38530 [Catellatospora sp. NPDC049111]|uniref:hypothetical protein n=1 Tax=Catellatospora sp. NPDC049111 TaxID=3155271 RepID=UPI0033E3CF4A
MSDHDVRPVAGADLSDPEALLRGAGWEGHEPAHRDARWLPYVLRALLHPDPVVQADAFWDLEPLRHQNTIYTVVVPAAQYIAAILADPRTATVCPFGRFQWSRDEPIQLRAKLIMWLADLTSDAGWRAGQDAEADAVLSMRPAFLAAIDPYLHDEDDDVSGAAVDAAVIMVEAVELIHRREEITELGLKLEVKRHGVPPPQVAPVYVAPRYRSEDIPLTPPLDDVVMQAARVWALGDPWAEQ